MYTGIPVVIAHSISMSRTTESAHWLISDRDGDCEKHTWYLSVDYATMREEVAETSGYYKCTLRSPTGTAYGDELKREQEGLGIRARCVCAWGLA